MSVYETSTSMTQLKEIFLKVSKRQRKIYEKALKACGADDDTRQSVKYLLGHGKSCTQSTEARLSDKWKIWESLFDSLRQLKDADPRMLASFKQYLMSENAINEYKPHDLMACKRAIEPQLKREFDGYVAKFAYLVNDGIPMTAVNVIGFSLDALATPDRVGTRRVSKRHSIVEPSKTISASSKSCAIAAMIAEFLQPSGSDTGGEQPDPREYPAVYISALIYRGLMRADRTYFGYGIGKKVVRRVVAQLVNQAAASDILDRSPLQPEGVLSLLASLPIDSNGTTATLPPVKLP